MKVLLVADSEQRELWDYWDTVGKKKTEGVRLILSAGDLRPEYPHVIVMEHGLLLHSEELRKFAGCKVFLVLFHYFAQFPTRDTALAQPLRSSSRFSSSMSGVKVLSTCQLSRISCCDSQ